MKNTFSLLFYLKKPKNYVAGAMPIYMRITVDGVPKELSTGKQCEPDRWNPKTLRLDGKKEDARTINCHLKNPEGMEKKTKKLEAQQLAIAKAEAAAREVAKEAVKAKKKAKRLKKVSGKL